MALDKILDEIRRIKAELTANRQAEALRIAFDQLALTKLRIQQQAGHLHVTKLTEDGSDRMIFPVDEPLV